MAIYDQTMNNTFVSPPCSAERSVTFEKFFWFFSLTFSLYFGVILYGFFQSGEFSFDVLVLQTISGDR